MHRLLLVWFLLLASIACIAQSERVSAFWQSRDSNYNISVSGGGGGYTGPGDVVSGAVAWWGLRCYRNAYSGNVADLTDTSTGNTTGTRLQCSSGTVSALVSGSACTFVTGNACSSIAVTCAVSCNILTLYDQSGANNCTSTACDLTQSINASRPLFAASGLGGRPTLNCNSGSGVLVSNNALGGSVPGPYTISAVAERVSGSTVDYPLIVGSATTVFGAFFDVHTAGNVAMYTGALIPTAPAADNAFHAAQFIFNSSSSAFYVDGTASGAVDTGNTDDYPGQQFAFCATGVQTLTGFVQEAGLWSVGFSSGQQSSMNSNQHAYWGF